MDIMKILALLLFYCHCIKMEDHQEDLEDRILKVQRRINALKEDLQAIESNAEMTETDLEENKNSLEQMFYNLNKIFDGNKLQDIKDRFSKHYLKRERRKLFKLLQEPKENEAGEQEDNKKQQDQKDSMDQMTEDVDQDLNTTLEFEDFGVVFRASKLTKTTFGEDTENTQKETIIFSNIEYNVGEGYNSTTGLFTTPRKGTYLFTVQFYVKYHYRIEAGIFVNGENTIAITSLSPGNNACYNFEGITNLEKGDVVQVTHLYSKGDRGLDNELNSNFFSGAMIR
ncbi:uncharacterized protein LOC132715478 [Ruditapes philippinarum]|uniref:uncharacterized protein LOC132715478 n=1 Tax=Ruditapes philippinarum TaxID=129788 RepID=UPI00295B1B32|nr:uncharacterized protein LOC132715478 [Ruditapes philippinarum]